MRWEFYVNFSTFAIDAILFPMKDIYAVLQELGISHVRHDHPAVFTVEESEKIGFKGAQGGDTKNLFLRNKKGDRHYLVSIGHHKKADLAELRQKLGESSLSFASPERLLAKLGLTPGSVSLLGLVNNAGHDVIVIIDKALWENPVVCCHPNANTATLEIPHDGLEKFLQHCGNELRVMEL